MNDKPLTLEDVPYTHEHGAVGIRVDDDGRVWVPIGWNMRSRYLTRTNEHLAHIQARKQWEADQRAGARKTAGGLQVSLARCSFCDICIGRGYWQRELYIRPLLGKDQLEWKTLCGRCATVHFGLHFGFCVVAERDWTGPHNTHIIRLWGEAVRRKYLRLEAEDGDDVFGTWVRFEELAYRRWRREHGDPFGYHEQRQLMLDKIIATQQPEVVTFTQLFEEQTQKRAA